MISDAEFWMETRRSMNGGDTIFKSMLALIHARQSTLDAHSTTTDKEEYKLTSWGRKHRDEASGRVYGNEEKREMEQSARQKEAVLRDSGKPLEANKAFSVVENSPDTQQYGVASSTLRVLQQVMMFAVPIYALRYNIPAMSMSWNTSCFIDRQTKQLITFGAGHGVKVPQHLRGRGCVAGDGFFAILSSQDEVWASGGLKVSSSSVDGPTALGIEDAMTGIAGKTLMLVGHGQRLAIVTRAFTVRPLSALSNPTRSIIPARHVRFLDLGYGEDYYMVGTDSIVYKTTASKRAVSTPRRVMTLCRTPVSRVASGTGFLLIIDQNGHLYTFGRNKKGQLGNGEIQDARRKPCFVEELSHHFIVQVAAGDCHSLALASNGRVYGAGSSESGQLGLGRDVKQVAKFTPIPLGNGDLRCIGIAAGPAGSMFYCDNGLVFTCGLNDSMQLGLDTTEKVVCEPTPVAVLADGVESYTMDFGGFRRPEGEEPTPSADPSTDRSGAGPSRSANSANLSGFGMRARNPSVSQNATVINISDSPGANKNTVNVSDGLTKAGSNNGSANNNAAGGTDSDGGGARRGGNAGVGSLRVDATLGNENHQPIDDADEAPAFPKRGAGNPRLRHNENIDGPKNEKVKGKCGCCAVM
ncbi:hypothetical protein ABB37_03352 [Leptomonas pyrrhocoris]|uniref:Regulator of chromosome condensation n=1 Tax=Leptomonas pyrrhocoris TaxID=157538 RepID=A0A0N0VG57_LEPPY|nr:hypothetical protein ABB37_03352 [Leptomonas pyrrhocoris]KPA82238.1 hypothetical protein ABB37_03352 [Leptomonas pyrrhocoris]|eukprot:XP_015660677.1 hypothetical protein ABB37_03352 [Leptomonas pyrrhocoris]